MAACMSGPLTARRGTALGGRWDAGGVLDGRYLTRDRIAVAAAVLAPLAAAAVLLPFRASWSNTNVALLLVVIVVAVAAIGNRVAGGIAAVSAAAWFDFFFTRPYERFAITKSADITTALLLLLVGLAVSQLAARARQLQVVAITDAAYLAQVHDAASLTQAARSPHAVVELVTEQLTRLPDRLRLIPPRMWLVLAVRAGERIIRA